MTATYQFNLEPSGTWRINVSDGSFNVHEGAAEKPTTTFIMKGEDYVSMVNGDLNGQMAAHDRQDEDQGCDPDGDEAQADLSANNANGRASWRLTACSLTALSAPRSGAVYASINPANGQPWANLPQQVRPTSAQPWLPPSVRMTRGLAA